MKKELKSYTGFSLAEALITLLIVCIIAIASAPVITKRHKLRTNIPHGAYACYWSGENLIAKYIINGTISDGKVIYDAEEGRYGCEFNPPPQSKGFVATIVGGGGGGAGAGLLQTNEHQNYGEAGTFTFKTKDAGIYQMIAVGAGGGGGDDSRVGGNSRACTGSTGAIVYVPGTVLAKDIDLNINVGRGGDVGWSNAESIGMGTAGGNTSITANGITYASAGGGGGGCSYYLRGFINAEAKKKNKIIGYSVANPNTQIALGWDYKGYSISNSWQAAQGITSGPAGKAASDLPNAKLIEGKRLGALDTYGQHQQYWANYNMIPQLTNYSSTFGVNFNHITKRGDVNHIGVCRSSNWMNNASICKNYELHYGSGGGGDGDWAEDYDFQKLPGIQGFAGISYKPIYAGLGGQAGSVAQIPYADMPQKTLLFPGKGGAGGKGTSITKSSGSSYISNEKTAGANGQDSYIKNGAHIMKGTGAPKIVPNDDSTYSTEYNENNFPVGKNGKLADVLTSKKIGTGGLGGLNSGNNSIDGGSQTVFEGGVEIKGFNQIYGAGAGGGGGAISAQSAADVYAGDGGKGTSGLVFIQW